MEGIPSMACKECAFIKAFNEMESVGPQNLRTKDRNIIYCNNIYIYMYIYTETLIQYVLIERKTDAYKFGRGTVS